MQQFIYPNTIPVTHLTALVHTYTVLIAIFW